jgi:UDP-glucose 4-epimerase
LDDKEIFPYQRAIILGSTGFLGKTIERLLRKESIAVRGYGSAELDLRKAEMFEKLDHDADKDAVLVFASALTPRKGVTLDNLNDNILMCGNVARYLEQHPVGLCVYISSDAVYPFSSNPISEESHVEPASLYALGKYSGERMLQHVAGVNAMSLLILRPTALYGAGDTGKSYGPNQFIHSLMESQSVRLFGGGDEQRDHLYVEDAARLIHLLIGAKATGTFNLATGRSCSFADIVKLLRAIVPVPFEIVSAPRRTPITHRHFDMSQLFLRLPEFRFTTVEEGLRALYRERAAQQR